VRTRDKAPLNNLI